VLEGVGERFAHHEVRRRLDLRGEPLVGHVEHRADRGAAGQLRQGRRETGVEGGRADAVGELAQTADRVAQPVHRLVELVSDRRAGSSPACRCRRSRPMATELLLGAVVEVALEPASFVHRGADDPRPRPLDLGELPAHLDAEPGDLDGQPRADEQVLELVADRRARSACTTVPSGRSPRRTGVRPDGAGGRSGRQGAAEVRVQPLVRGSQ
jgi:hypothetical protein